MPMVPPNRPVDPVRDALLFIARDPNIDPAFRAGVAIATDVAPLPGSLPPMRLEPAPGDFEARGVHALLILSVAKEELRKLIEDTAPHSHEIDGDALIESLNAHLTDLGGEISGEFHAAAESLRDDLYGGVSVRGPFYRRRAP